MNIEVTDELLFKYFESKATEEECKSIFDWLSHSEKNKRLFAILKKLHIEIQVSNSELTDKTDAALNSFLKKVQVSESVSKIEGGILRIIRFKKILRYAALILILVSVSIGAGVLIKNKESILPASSYVIEVPYGGRSNITLPDGSKVWLNAGSKLTYKSDFSAKSRKVEIEGEAYFDIQKSKYPFIVTTSHFDIRVLGTSFNVKSYPDEDEIETTLVEGKIRIEREGINDVLELKPKEKLTYHKESRKANLSSINVHANDPDPTEARAAVGNDETESIEIFENVPTEQEVSWKDGDMIFNKEPLSELAKKLERKYDIEFVFTSSELRTYSYSGTLRDFPLEQVLRALELTSPVRYSIVGKTVTLTMVKQNDKSYNRVFK